MRSIEKKHSYVNPVKDKKITICFVGCFPPSRGRLSEYTYHLLYELQRIPQIGRIEILADRNSYTNIKQINDKTFLRRVWRVDNPVSLAILPLRIFRLKPDLVHFNVHMAVFGKSRIVNFIGLFSTLICRLMGLKTVISLHNIADTIDIEKAGYKNTLLNRVGATVVTKSLSFASAITVTVKYYLEVLNKKYRANNVFWIPHGTWKTDPVYVHHTKNPKTILYIGHSGPYKDLGLLFKALELLNRKKRKTRLIVAGESHPNYPNFLDECKCWNHLTEIRFIGYVPNEEFQSLFGKVDLVVLPYHMCTGTSGIAHLASSYGVPIIAMDLPEFRELVQDGCGIILSQHDPEVLAKSISYVLNHSSLIHNLKEKNLKFADERTWDKIAMSFSELYEQVVGST